MATDPIRHGRTQGMHQQPVQTSRKVMVSVPFRQIARPPAMRTNFQPLGGGALMICRANLLANLQLTPEAVIDVMGNGLCPPVPVEISTVTLPQWVVLDAAVATPLTEARTSAPRIAIGTHARALGSGTPRRLTQAPFDLRSRIDLAKERR